MAAGMRTKILPGNLLAIYDMGGRSMEFHQAFEEFREVQHKLRGDLPAWMNAGNELIRPLEYSRISVLKYLARSPAAILLRPLWLAFKRKL